MRFLTFSLLVFVVDALLFAGEEQERPKAPASADNRRSESLFKPLGVPDYTKMTGFAENAILPTQKPSSLWKISTENVKRDERGPTIGLTDAVIADGVIYFGDHLGNLSAIRTTDEAELWSTPTGSRISVKPSVDADFVYFGSEKGIRALDRTDGEILWEFNLAQGASEATPIPVGEFLYASGYDGHSYCLRRRTGEVVWRHNFVEDAPADKLNEEFDGARARFDGTLARPNGAACDGELFIQAVFDQSRVIAIDCKTGKRRWTFQAKGWISPAPTIANDRVYIASQDRHLYCVDRRTGELAWKYDAKKWLASRVAVHDGKVYLPVHGPRLHQISASSGQLIRIMEPSDAADQTDVVYSFPLISGRTVYFASGSGLLFAFDIQTGEMKWKLRPSESSELLTDPVTDGRNIYVTCRQTIKHEGEDALLAIGIQD